MTAMPFKLPNKHLRKIGINTLLFSLPLIMMSLVDVTLMEVGIKFHLKLAKINENGLLLCGYLGYGSNKVLIKAQINAWAQF